jgi:hypothetical protein
MEFVARVSATGAVLELGDGAVAIVDAAKGPGNMHELTDLALRQLVTDSVGFLPHRRTAAGANWERERLDSLGRLVTRQKLALRLSDVAPETFTIEGKGTVDLAHDVMIREVEKSDDLQKAEMLRQLKSTKVEKGTVECSQKTSREDGFVLEASLTMEIDLVTSESSMGGATTHMKVTTTVERTTAEQAKPKPAEPDAGR